MTNRTLVRAALVLSILGAALALRVWGLDWSVPTELHYNSYHGGESRAVAVGLQLKEQDDLCPRWGSENEPYFSWGSHYIYVAYGAVRLSEALGYLEIDGAKMGAWSHETFARAHVVARGVSALYGTATVLLILCLARAAWGWRAGLWAGALTAVCPLLAVQARFATVNTCHMFWCTAAVALMVVLARRATWGSALGAGVGVGLAIAAKLSALPLFGPGLVALGLAAYRRRASGFDGRFAALGALVALVGVALGFGLASPYAYLYWDVFWEQLQGEMRHAEGGHGIVFAGTGNGLIYLFGENLWIGLGPPLWVASLVGLLWALAAAARGLRLGQAREGSTALALDVLALAWFATNVAVLADARTRFLRYLLPIAPFACLFAGRVLAQLSGSSRRPSVRYAVRAIAVLVVALTGLYAAATVRPFAHPDPRDDAARWMFENVPAGARVGFVKRPCHVTPPIYPAAPGPAGFPDGTPRYRGVVLNASPERLEREAPEWLVLNTVELRDEERVGRAPYGALRSADELLALDVPPDFVASVQDGLRFADRLAADYELVWSRKNEAALFGVSVEWPEPPQGWAAAVQEIQIWRRRAADGAPSAGSEPR